MDVDFWAARVHSSKHHHHSAVQATYSADSHVNMDNGDDDVQAWFPCPFCYVEIEVPVFCSHLQEYHCFDVKNAVCPICAATLGKDAIEHFTFQHAHSVKRRRKSPKSGSWNNSPATKSKNFREPRAFLATNSLSTRNNEHEPGADPLISPFICPISRIDSNDKLDDVSSTDASLTTDGLSNIQPFSDPIRENEYRERKERSAFLQELIFSTIF